MFYKSYSKSEARAFDHLYDPIYTTGDYQRDIQRENAIALTNTAPVNIYTNFNSMFSELLKRPRTHNVLQRNQLPTKAPQANVSSDKVTHRVHGSHGDDASGRNRAKFFAIPHRKSGIRSTKNTILQFSETSDEKMQNARAMSVKQPQRLKSRSISCQTIYREQSAQTKPYLPQIHYRPGIEKSELFHFNAGCDIDAPFTLSEIVAINRQRKRSECEKILKQSNDLVAQKKEIFETLEWQEWLTHEKDIETVQSLRLRSVQEKLKQRNKLFESDSIKVIDLSINRLNYEQKRQTETITKKYERSMRKLRKSVYNGTENVGDKNATIYDAIQKLRHGNLNNSIASTGQVERKYEITLNRIEKIGTDFTINYEQAMYDTDSQIERPKKVICEIMPGFLKDNNLRIVYEALKAYRLQQSIHNEIASKLKSIDKIRALARTSALVGASASTSTAHNEKMTWKITDQKNRIAEMLKMLGYLRDLLQNIAHISIDSYLELLTHKFHVIETESSINDLLNFDIQKLMSTPQFNLSSSSSCSRPLSTHDISSAYLNDILQRCSELKSEQKNRDEINNTGPSMVDDDDGIDDMMRDIIWPDIMNRLEYYLKNRKKQIKVDLSRLTSEETAMVESIRNECVESIMEDLFHSKE